MRFRVGSVATKYISLLDNANNQGRLLMEMHASPNVVTHARRREERGSYEVSSRLKKSSRGAYGADVVADELDI